MMHLSLLIACPALLLTPSASVLRASPVMQLRDQQPAVPVQPREVQQVVPVGTQNFNRAPVGTQNFNSQQNYQSYQSGRTSTTTGTRTRSLADISRAKQLEDPSILVQGGSLRTWSYRNPAVQAVQVQLSTEGRPLDADIELWHGPDNTPVKMRVYVENGEMRPFSCVIETPRGPNTIALRNIGQLEFPFAANVFHDRIDQPSNECLNSATTIQGGALRTYPFDPSVDSVQIMLTTDGRPLNARIELLQGPNNNKEVIELYTEDGLNRPFFCTLRTPGSGNVVRVVNTAPVEFPMAAAVVAFEINNNFERDAVLGGDVVVGGDSMQW